MTKKSLVSTIALAVAVSLSSGAYAAQINEWSFAITQNFLPSGTEWTGLGSNPSDPFGENVDTLPNGEDPAGSYSFVRWGVPNNSDGNRSFLAADTNFTQTNLVTNGGSVYGSNFYHGNYELRSGNQYEKSLAKTELETKIQLISTDPAGYGGMIERTFTINFSETTNSSNGVIVPIESCEGYDVWGSTPGVVSCPDRFSIDISDLTFVTPEIDGYIYTFTVSFDTLAIDGANGIVGYDVSDDGIATIWTNEFGLATIRTLVSVVSTPVQQVPEPASLGLLGGGLLAAGMGLRRRRRK